MSELGALSVRAYLLACVLAGVIGLFIGRVAWAERDEPGGLEVALYATFGGLVAVSYAVRVVADDPGTMTGALQLSTPFLAAMPVVWIAFAFAYAGRDKWRSEPRIVALAAPAFVWVLLALSSRTHGLAWRSAGPVRDGPFMLLDLAIGPATAAFAAYAYVLYAAGVLVIADLYRRTGDRYRLQTFVALLGTLFPLVAGAVTLVDLGSYAGLSWLPAALVVHAVFLYGVVFWLGTLDAAVVARDTAVEVMQDPVIVAGSDGQIRDLNPAAKRLLPPEPVGDPLATAFPVIESGTGHPVSIGDRRFDIQEDPITDPRGTDRGHVFLLRDVTAREQRQAELERRETQLERQNERLEEFAGVVSHDLRNPLAAASAAVELARHAADDEPLERAAAAHDRMDQLIEGLLSLATAGKTVDAVERVSLDAAVRTAWSRMETRAATLEVADRDVTLLADDERLQQLLSNLFRNAIEHGGDDVAVRVSAERTSDALIVRVADDGPGIPGDERGRVFERGVSLGDGTGLGLAIVADVAEAHGWTVEAVDGPTAGACFEIAGIEPADD